METYNKESFLDIDIEKEFVQDNISISSMGVLRGLHFQTNRPQAKLVQVIRGSVFDVVVDIRKDSETYLKNYAIVLSEKHKQMLYVPEGLAHGFLSLSEVAVFKYKVSDYYFAQYEKGIIWNDANINIKWPLKEYNLNQPILSEKDSALPDIEKLESEINTD